MALGFLRGKSGELRAGYHSAAKLGRWTAYKGADGSWAVEAPASDINPFWIKRGESLRASLRVGVDRWSWRKVEMLSRENGAVSFRLSGEIDKEGGVYVEAE